LGVKVSVGEFAVLKENCDALVALCRRQEIEQVFAA